MRLLALHLPAAAQADDVAVRAELMLASVLCGQGTDYTGAGITIPLGHALSARFHIDNGLVNAILIPYALRFNAEAAKPGLEKLATSLGLSRSEAGPLVTRVSNAFEAIFRKVGIPPRLRDVGVSREALPDMAAVSMEDWFVRDNPRPVRSAAELQQILEEAW